MAGEEHRLGGRGWSRRRRVTGAQGLTDANSDAAASRWSRSPRRAPTRTAPRRPGHPGARRGGIGHGWISRSDAPRGPAPVGAEDRAADLRWRYPGSTISIRPWMMGWTPLPDGIAMCQGEGIGTPPGGRGIQWSTLPSSGSICEAQFSAPRRTAGRVGGLSQEAEPGQGAGRCRVAPAMRRGDGGMRECPPLGPPDRAAWSCGAAGPAGLREAVRETAEERRGRRGSDLRGGLALVVESHDAAIREVEICHYEADARKQLARVMLGFRRDPSGRSPALRLIPETLVAYQRFVARPARRKRYRTLTTARARVEHRRGEGRPAPAPLTFGQSCHVEYRRS